MALTMPTPGRQAPHASVGVGEWPGAQCVGLLHHLQDVGAIPEAIVAQAAGGQGAYLRVIPAMQLVAATQARPETGHRCRKAERVAGGVQCLALIAADHRVQQAAALCIG